MISTTLSIDTAMGITHNGTFHADEVMATVILSKVFGDFSVFRTSEVPENVSPNTIVYDIGYGKFDHHQNGGNGIRKNGVPYASSGLIWKEFGHKIVEDCNDPDFAWRLMDYELIQGIDARDNGVIPLSDYPAQTMTISTAISKFNPIWDSSEDSDFNFLIACDFAEVIFNLTLENVLSKVRAFSIVEKAIEESNDHIMILDQFMPWQDFIFLSNNPKANDILFVVYPSNRGGYNWKCVPDNSGSFGQRKKVPDSWKGLSDSKLQEVTGIQTATFCHPGGFIGGAKTLEDALALAQLAVES